MTRTFLRILCAAGCLHAPANLGFAKPPTAGYKPQVLKAGPAPTSLIVLDPKLDKAGGEEIAACPKFDRVEANTARKQYRMYPFYSQAKEALATTACLQGLINRRSGRKVYFTGFPMRWLWDANSGGLGRPVRRQADASGSRGTHREWLLPTRE